VIGSYSCGKTSFIQYRLAQDYPGLSVGAEPTTDKFTVIMHGEGRIPGDAAVRLETINFSSIKEVKILFFSQSNLVSLVSIDFQCFSAAKISLTVLRL